MIMTIVHEGLGTVQQLIGDTPNPGRATLPGDTQAKLNTVLGWVKYLGLAAAVAGLFIVAAKMSISHRTGGGGEHLAGLGYVAGALVIIGGATSIVSFLVT